MVPDASIFSLFSQKGTLDVSDTIDLSLVVNIQILKRTRQPDINLFPDLEGCNTLLNNFLTFHF